MTSEEYRNKYLNNKSQTSQNVRARNMRSKENGELFETQILNMCEYYKNNEIAFIEKTPEPMKIIKSLGNNLFECVFRKKAQPDFKGVLKGGKCIHFEAKSSCENVIHQNRVTKEQADSLNISYKLGAECGVALTLGFRRFYYVPWNIWSCMKEKYGRAYMTEDDLKPYIVKITIYGVDFLSKT